MEETTSSGFWPSTSSCSPSSGGWFDPDLANTIHFVHNVSLATWVWGLAMVVPSGPAVVALGIASVFQPTTSGLDTTWSALAVLRGLAVVVACEWSASRRETLRTDTEPSDEDSAVVG